MTDIITKAKENFAKYLKENEDVFGLKRHLPLVEKWAQKIIQKHTEADTEIVLLGVWLHDIAHYPPDPNSDHAVKGETVAVKFLAENNYDESKTKAVAHLVRSHRCKDVLPETLEAKILACADSASHLTDSMYIDIVIDGRADYALGKLERDYRDTGIFPELQQELKPLYEAWKTLITALISVK